MMKKILFVISLVAASFGASLLSPSSATGQAEISFTPSQINVEVGGEIVLDLNLATGEKVYSLDFKITYPPDKLTFTDFDLTGSLVTNWAKKRETVPGSIDLTGGIQKGFAGQGSAVRLKFIAKQSGQAQVTPLNSSLLLNESQKDILGRISPATVNIGATAPPPSPTAVPQPEKKSTNLTAFIFLPILIILAAGIYLYRKKKSITNLPPFKPPTNPPVIS